MDQHAWQGLTAVVLAALAIFNTNTFSPIGNGDRLGITTIQAKKKTHQPPDLLGQQITILVGLGINPNWVRKQSIADSLIYGIVRPNDTVPTGVNEDYGYLVANDHGKEISLFFKTDEKKVTVEYANRDEELHTKTVPLSRLIEQLCRTKKQHQQMNKHASTLRTE